MDSRISKELGPRKQAVKSLEMTVRRGLALIQVFDDLPPEAKDWTDAQPKDIRNAMGTDSFDPRMAQLPELWKRYKDRSLHQQILELAENLVMEDLSKKSAKEIKDGLNRLNN